MHTFFLVLHIMTALCLIGFVLMQKTSDGALMQSEEKRALIRGASQSLPNVLRKMTTICVGIFLLSSLFLVWFYRQEARQITVESSYDVRSSTR